MHTRIFPPRILFNGIYHLERISHVRNLIATRDRICTHNLITFAGTYFFFSSRFSFSLFLFECKPLCFFLCDTKICMPSQLHICNWILQKKMVTCNYLTRLIAYDIKFEKKKSADRETMFMAFDRFTKLTFIPYIFYNIFIWILFSEEIIVDWIAQMCLCVCVRQRWLIH